MASDALTGKNKGGQPSSNAAHDAGANMRPVHFYHDFQKFMYTNDVVVAASGFSIGAITKEFITGILDQIVLPIVEAIANLSVMRKARKYMYGTLHRRFLAAVTDRVTNVLWLAFVWIATIILTFVVLEYVLNMMFLRMRTHMSKKETRLFNEAKGLVSNKNTKNTNVNGGDVQGYDAAGSGRLTGSAVPSQEQQQNGHSQSGENGKKKSSS